LGTSVYSATKGALNKIAQIAANELADRKIRVNIVSPGPVQTPGLEYAVPAEAKAYLAAATAGFCKDWAILMKLQKRYCSWLLTACKLY
jgi:NAD(P)-dependent dehydrogenase (short-subunit alcohol dehydrogenase family)